MAGRTVKDAPRLPDFLVIGAMKAGSTTLWRLLAGHPAIFMCEPKEPQFFSRDERYAQGIASYARSFAAARRDQLAGEASTCYSRWPHHGDVPARIAGHLPRAKLVYLLRHPVERAYSHYGHLMEERVVKGTGPVLPFARALDEIPEITDASNYWLQIERFLAHFERSAIHVLTLDDLRSRPEVTWRALQDFLGVPAIALPEPEVDADNVSGTRLARGTMRRMLQRVRARSGVARLIDMVPRDVRRRGRAWLESPRVARVFMRSEIHAHRQRISPMTPKDRERLLAALDAPTRALARFLGRDLTSWLQ